LSLDSTYVEIFTDHYDLVDRIQTVFYHLLPAAEFRQKRQKLYRTADHIASNNSVNETTLAWFLIKLESARLLGNALDGLHGLRIVVREAFSRCDGPQSVDNGQVESIGQVDRSAGTRPVQCTGHVTKV
jgi:hypothetical protein